MNLACKTIDSPVGKLKLVASDKGLVAILWQNEKPNRVRLGELVEDASTPFSWLPSVSLVSTLPGNERHSRLLSI